MAEEKKLEQEYLPEEITEKDVKKSWLTYYFFAETFTGVRILYVTDPDL